MATAEKPVLSNYKARMDKAVSALKEELASLRTGRASASLLDQIHVDAYGASSPINQVAAISVPEPRMITVNVWDRALVVSVEKAIRASDLGLNPVVDGQTLRLPIPPLTSTPAREIWAISSATAARVRGSIPKLSPPTPASPESFRRMRLWRGAAEAIGESWESSRNIQHRR